MSVAYHMYVLLYPITKTVAYCKWPLGLNNALACSSALSLPYAKGIVDSYMYVRILCCVSCGGLHVYLQMEVYYGYDRVQSVEEVVCERI